MEPSAMSAGIDAMVTSGNSTKWIVKCVNTGSVV